MILTVPLQSGTSLSNVRYRWLVAGAYGAELSSGITQPTADFPVFRLDVIPPVGAEEVYVYDSTDLTNWNVGNYIEAVAAADVNSGFGALEVHITVRATDNRVLEAASVRLTLNDQITYCARTNADGVAIFGLDPATYRIVITLPGFQFTPQDIVVDSDHVNFTKTMTPVAQKIIASTPLILRGTFNGGSVTLSTR